MELVPTPPSRHHAPAEAAAFLAGALTPEANESFENHLDVCADCRRALSERVRARRGDQSATPTDQIAPPRPLPVELGEVVDGRYRVERLIGIGGMGCVFHAHHLHLNQAVALKLMLPDLANDGNAVARFMREARAAARLHTEHVGRVLELGTLPKGTPYLVMELLTGESVADRLTREGPYSPRLATDVLRQAIEALEEAHGLGIVHRDLKPSNLFIARTSDGHEVVKVLDFGIAKSVHPDIEAGLERSSQRMLVGSPLYMAPEQLAAGAAVTPAVDVWALGSTLYELLAGRAPFAELNGSLVDLMYAITHRPHAPLPTVVPEHLRAAVDGCLAKKPEERWTLARLSSAVGVTPLGTAAVKRRADRRGQVGFALALVAAALTVVAPFTGLDEPAPAPVVVSPPPPRAAAPPPKVVAPVEAVKPAAAPAPVKKKRPARDAAQLDSRR